MGLLDKKNPDATPESARRSALNFSVLGGVIGLIGWYRSDMPDAAVVFIVPFMTISCAIAGWAIEWQMPSELDDEG